MASDDIILKRTTQQNGPGISYWFWCPGCSSHHRFITKAFDEGDPEWTFNGNMDRPTFNPSLLHRSNGKTYCHLFIRNGMIEYLGDCPHHLAGQTVDMEPLP